MLTSMTDMASLGKIQAKILGAGVFIKIKNRLSKTQCKYGGWDPNEKVGGRGVVG